MSCITMLSSFKQELCQLSTNFVTNAKKTMFTPCCLQISKPFGLDLACIHRHKDHRWILRGGPAKCSLSVNLAVLMTNKSTIYNYTAYSSIKMQCLCTVKTPAKKLDQSVKLDETRLESPKIFSET